MTITERRNKYKAFASRLENVTTQLRGAMALDCSKDKNIIIDEQIAAIRGIMGELRGCACNG